MDDSTEPATTETIIERYSGLARLTLAGTPRDDGCGCETSSCSGAASALTAEEYRRELQTAGFTAITITTTTDTGDRLNAAIVHASKPTP